MVTSMWVWPALFIVFVVAVVALWRFARYANGIEDDSRYLAEEQPRAPYGQKFLNILRGRG
jgi:hypothetical protein